MDGGGGGEEGRHTWVSGQCLLGLCPRFLRTLIPDPFIVNSEANHRPL